MFFQDKQNSWSRNFLKLAFRHAGACLTLLYNTVEENLRGMKERMSERMTHTRAFAKMLKIPLFFRKDFGQNFMLVEGL